MTLVKFNRQSPTHGFDRLFEDFFSNDFFKPVFRESGNMMPSANISESDKSYQIELVVPGLEKGDFEIQLDQNVLSIKGERSNTKEDVNYKTREFNFQSFQRSFKLPKEIFGEKIKAAYENGILIIDIPKKEIQNAEKVKTIKVG